MSRGPLGLAWDNLRQKMLDDGRYSVDQLDLETWRLMFMWGARTALTVPPDKVSRAMLLAEVLTFELGLKDYGRPRNTVPVLAVIDGGCHDQARDDPQAPGTLPQ